MPLVAAGAYAWGMALRVLGRLRAPVVTFVAGAGAWAGAVTIEVFQVKGQLRPGAIDSANLSDAEFQKATDAPGYTASMVSEEILEMTGSLLFVLALLAAVRAALARRDWAVENAGAAEPALV